MSIIKAAALAVIAVFSVGTAGATPVLSGDGTETCVLGTPLGGGACSVVSVDPYPAWHTLSTAKWISYGDTGYKGTLLAPTTGTTPLFSVSEQLNVTVKSQLLLSVWADDTAGVFLNSTQLTSQVGSGPNFSQDTCAKGSLGCEPGEEGVFMVQLDPGIHNLTFEAYQVGTGLTTTINPFGLMYSGELMPFPSEAGTAGGSATPMATPVPASGLLLAGALVGFGLLRRRQQARR